ncbi:unnamed protein product, partial [Linum tenue]
PPRSRRRSLSLFVFSIETELPRHHHRPRRQRPSEDLRLPSNPSPAASINFLALCSWVLVFDRVESLPRRFALRLGKERPSAHIFPTTPPWNPREVRHHRLLVLDVEDALRVPAFLLMHHLLHRL